MELSYGITLEQKQQLSQGQIQSLEVLANGQYGTEPVSPE